MTRPYRVSSTSPIVLGENASPSGSASVYAPSSPIARSVNTNVRPQAAHTIPRARFESRPAGHTMTRKAAPPIRSVRPPNTTPRVMP